MTKKGHVPKAKEVRLHKIKTGADVNVVNGFFWASKQTLEEFGFDDAKMRRALGTLIPRLLEVVIKYADAKQGIYASGERQKKALTAAIDTLLADNPNVTAKEGWRKVENLPEAKGKTGGAFASLLSRRKKKSH